MSRLIRGVLGDGMEIRFWLDVWLGDEPLSSVFPNLFQLERCKNVSVADRVGAAGLGPVWDWIRGVGSGLESTELGQLGQWVGNVSIVSRKDKWVWALHGVGLYSVRSLKEELKSIRYNRPAYVFRRNSWVPKKVEIMAWRAEMGRLPTLVALQYRNVYSGSVLCPFCRDYPESVDHLFVECGFIQTVWQVIEQWCKIDPVYVFGIRDILELAWYAGGSAKKKKALHAICLVVLWSVWKLRNEVVFRQSSFAVQKVIGEVKTMSFIWVKSRAKQEGLEYWHLWRSFNLQRIGW